MSNAFAPQGTTTYDGTFHVVPGILTLDTYPSGGYTPVASQARISNIRRARPNARSSLGYLIEWDGTKIRAYRGNPAGGLQSESLPDVYGGLFASITSDAAAAALNDALVMALTDATVTTAGGLAHLAGKTTGITAPNTLDAEVSGRNVVIVQNQNGAGGSWTAGWCRVIGTAPDGSAQTEDIALQTSAIADTKFRLVVGAKAFGTVTSITLLNSAKTAGQAGPASSRLSIGIGTIFGLRGAITAESDIKSIRKDAAAIAAATYIGTATPSQVDLGADVADGVDLIVAYDASASNLSNVEAATSANVGTVFLEYLGD